MTDTRPPADPARLLTIEDVARRLNVSPTTAARLRAAGRLPQPLRVGGRLLRWCPVALAAWIANGCPSAAEWAARTAGTGRKPKPMAQYSGPVPVC